MKQMKRLSILFLSFLIPFLMTGCALIPQPIRNLIQTSTPTFTATPTNTATPTATPLPPLSLNGCPIQSECPDVPNLKSFYDGDTNTNQNYPVQFPFDAQVRVSTGWQAIDQATLDENLRNMEFFFKIDGIDYTADWMFENGTGTDTNENSGPAVYMGVILTGWQVGVSHKIEYGFIILNPINDGWSEYSPRVESHIFYVTPTNLPTATNTPLPTLTPKPYTPEPTLKPATAVPSCKAKSKITINNATGGSVTLYLSGPGEFTFYLTEGSNSLAVCPGSYTYTAYGCGGSSYSGSISAGTKTKFYCVSH